MDTTNGKTNAFAGALIALGLTVLITGVSNWQTTNPTRFYVYLLLSLLAAGLRVNVPQVSSTISATFVFILIAIADMSFPEALVLGCASAWVHAALHVCDRGVRIPPLFRVATTAVAIAICDAMYRTAWAQQQKVHGLLMLGLAATALYALNTFPIAAVMTLAQGRRLALAWQECSFWAFPYYIAGAAFAGLMHWIGVRFGWEASLLLLPVAFSVYSGFQFYLGRLAAQRVHLERMAALHVRTIEALALAIEAKDQTGPMHLPRLQLYCVEIGRELGMPADELEAMQAAALLHDIGKLAVPEHILSKPGRLTREEFEKVKIHPVVGAEILERVNFPYAVTPMVRFHHEKWNGGGYPAGIRGEAIPLGARILAVADCLDALISDRPYRKSIPISKAVEHISTEAGVSFDPMVVQVLRRRYGQLETMLMERAREILPSAAASGPRGALPAPGLTTATDSDVLGAIAAARREAQDLLELTHELGNSLVLDESLPMLASRLKPIVNYDCLVIYTAQDNRVSARFATGDSMSHFLARQIPYDQGLSGWVAEHRKPILNGDPARELNPGGEGPGLSKLESALAYPLLGVQQVAGVLLLLRRGKDAFARDDLRILQALGPKLGTVIENSLKYEQAAASASTDFLTGLPNARALFLQLDGEIARCRRLGGGLAVLVCDLDGFKQVNDEFGHLEGNNVLRAVGRALRHSVRDYDYVARLGGDEFVIVIPGLQDDALALKKSHLRQAAEEASQEAVRGSNVSLSIGQATFPEDGQEAEQLLAVADQRMYQGKQERKTALADRERRGFVFDSRRPTVH